MKVLITGGSGLVGRNLQDYLSKLQINVLAPSHSELELMDQVAIERYLVEHAPDLVVHAAGKVGGIQANIADPVGFLCENLEMGKNLVLAARNAGVKKLINLGSSCMYPKDHSGELSEDMVLSGMLEPTNEGYALAKIVVARLCSYIREKDSGYQYKTLIPCNLFGLYDKFDPKNSHLVPAIIKKVVDAKSEGKNTVEIWGDGTARREFMFATDLAHIIWESAQMIDRLPDLLNVGIGKDHSINDYYSIAGRVVGFEGSFTHDLSKPSGMKRKLVSVEKMHQLGLKAQTSLEEGLQKTYEYFINEVN
ncbi:MAG: GDP-fucose synthetase [Bdellovibrionaceae bacterium]|nr:GDP-fucose synthetase [Pseudobdellovibrionaceae bacterium]|tara:strand:+ start:63080 stop:64000 length:921 start_codon:yes stop_codon:yes gene_type:complete